MTPDDLVLTRQGIRFQGQYWPCSIGKAGISRNKHEGDGATPRGAHRIVGMLYRSDRMAAPAAWATPIRPLDLWSDDVHSPEYNLQVTAPYAGRHEKLWRADPLYDLVLLTNWNWPNPIPGKGSAIFIHQWRRPGYPTEGCVAFDRTHLRLIAGRITPLTHLIIP